MEGQIATFVNAHLGAALAWLGIGLLALAGLYLLGCLAGLVYWTKLWRRYADVTVAAGFGVLCLSLTSWAGAVVAFAYLHGNGVLFAHVEPGPSLVIAGPGAGA
jgi:hypothetical protein